MAVDTMTWQTFLISDPPLLKRRVYVHLPRQPFPHSLYHVRFPGNSVTSDLVSDLVVILLVFPS